MDHKKGVGELLRRFVEVIRNEGLGSAFIRGLEFLSRKMS